MVAAGHFGDGAARPQPPSVAIWSIGNEIPEVVVEKRTGDGKAACCQVRSLDTSRPLHTGVADQHVRTASGCPPFSAGHRRRQLQPRRNYAEDHRRVPSRLMVTTESFPAEAFEQWKLAKDNPFIIGKFVWTAMDYLGESGIGASANGTPNRAALAGKMMAACRAGGPNVLAMARRDHMRALMAQAGKKNPAAESAISVLSHSYHGAVGVRHLDLTGHRKPQVVLSRHSVERWRSRVRNRASAGAGREENHRRGMAVYPTLPSWTWPGRKARSCRWKFTREWTRYGFTSTTSSW